MVEGKHFTSDTAPEDVGRKAAAAALSDIAAMGAMPVGATVSLHAPAHWDSLAVMKGLVEELATPRLSLLWRRHHRRRATGGERHRLG